MKLEEERLALAEHWLGAGILAEARGDYSKTKLSDDDILDSIAALWTAHRIASGQAFALPGRSETDQLGLPMRIVY